MNAPINQAQAITNLQRYLRRLSYEGLEGRRVPIDGIYDTDTREAVTRFQKNMNIAPTGIVDKRTWDMLFDEYWRVTADERETEGLFLFPSTPTDYSVSLGEELLLVRIIQLLLIELRATYGFLEDITETGIYDEETERAIKSFQRANLLEETGRVDEATWNRIVREYSNLEKGIQ